MKQFSTFLTVVALMVLPACNRDNPSPEPVVGKPIRLSARVAAQTSDFAFDLARRLDKSVPAGANIFVSPLSLHIALGMLLNGATDETRDGILKTLKADQSSVEELNDAYQVLLRELPLADNKVKLAIANSMWYRKGLDVKQNFQEVIAGIFDSRIYIEPFDETTVQKINQWASDNTEGKIPKVLENLDTNLVMVLMNALYFKGDWKYKFDKNKTQDWDFQLAEGEHKKVKMMFVESDLRVHREADFTAVELPYASGQFNLTLFLPSPGKNVHEVVQNFNHEKWETVQSGLSKDGIKLGLPKFTLDYEIILNQSLAEMGMSRSFSEAQFGNISDKNLTVGFVKQNTFLGIDEAGTEAAAVTTIGFYVTSVIPEPVAKPIIADRPFFFTISENTSNTILFTGRIVNP